MLPPWTLPPELGFVHIIMYSKNFERKRQQKRPGGVSLLLLRLFTTGVRTGLFGPRANSIRHLELCRAVMLDSSDAHCTQVVRTRKQVPLVTVLGTTSFLDDLDR